MEKESKEISLYNETFVEFHLPRYKEIPDVGLLLEQTVRLINGYLEPLGVRITKSMISNYVKQRIIARPVKKLYYRDQIAALIFLALSKTVLSLEGISKYLNMQRRSYHEDVAYNYFCAHFEKGLHSRFSDGSGDASGSDATNPADTGAAGNDAFLVSFLVQAIVECIHLQYRISQSDL